MKDRGWCVSLSSKYVFKGMILFDKLHVDALAGGGDTEKIWGEIF